MAWDEYSDLFVTSRGRSTTNVPRSCIESAEYIIQCIANERLLKWESGKSNEPHVIAHFKDVEIDITDTQDFHDKGYAPKDYPFTGLPKIGQGLICLNKTKKDLGYNMHLGALVAKDDDKILISNMMEAFGISVKMAILQTIEIGSASEFRSRTFSGLDSSYALGLLEPK